MAAHSAEFPAGMQDWSTSTPCLTSRKLQFNPEVSVIEPPPTTANTSRFERTLMENFAREQQSTSRMRPLCIESSSSDEFEGDNDDDETERIQSPSSSGDSQSGYKTASDATCVAPRNESVKAAAEPFGARASAKQSSVKPPLPPRPPSRSTTKVTEEPNRKPTLPQSQSDDMEIGDEELAQHLNSFSISDEDVVEFTSDEEEESVVDVRGRESSSPEVIAFIPAADRVGVGRESSSPEVVPSTVTPDHGPRRVPPPPPKPPRRTAGFQDPEIDSSRLPRALKGSVEEVLTSLQRVISSVPKDDGENPFSQPKSLRVPLFGHQLYGLKWLWWREQEKPYGGILADEMGLGKTVMILALICRGREHGAAAPNEPNGWLSKEQGNLMQSQATLVVCPPSVLGQWEDEARKKAKNLKILVYHGPTRPKTSAALVQYDLVITTYNTLSSEIPKLSEQTKNACRSPIVWINWNRVVLDEGHIIKNHLTALAQAVCRIEARHRWVVTGTPIHNQPSDMYSLVKFLRLAPFDHAPVWESWIGMKLSARLNTHRLSTISKSLLLRRTKAEVMDQNANPRAGVRMDVIPPKTVTNVEVELTQQERDIYDFLEEHARDKLKLFMRNQAARMAEQQLAADNYVAGRRSRRGHGHGTQEDTKFSSILTLLLRIRQCAVLPYLIHTLIEDVDDTGEYNPEIDLLTPKNPVFSERYKSSKIEKVLEDLRDLKEECEARGERMEKVVIVSQWTSLLAIVESHLIRAGYSTTSIRGDIKVTDRTEIVSRFNEDPKRPQIMLLSLTAGGAGLNLVGANHLFFLDIHWNPQLELQAQDRIHRFGQKKPVDIRRYIAKETVENRVLDLQSVKLQLADGVLNNAQMKTGAGLSLGEMRKLFGV